MSRWWLGGLLLGALLVLLGLAVGLDRARARVRIHPGLTGGAEEPGSSGTSAGEASVSGREQARVGPAPRPTVLELRIVRDDGEPLQQAEVLVQRGGELLRAGRTWDEGRVTLVAFAGPGTARVRLAGREVARRELAQGSGRVEIVVPSGASVSGIVRVDGVPRGGVGLELADGPEEGWSARLVRRALEGVGWREREERQLTRSEEDGTFRFACLPADWSGGLRLARYERDSFRDGARRLELDRPRDGLVLDLREARREKVIRGRVVAGGQAVPGVRWEARGAGGNGARLAQDEGVCDELGRFTLAASDGLEWLRLEFFEPETGLATLEREEPELRAAVLELGDVELQPVRVIPFRVTTDAGVPLAGARARAWGEQSELELLLWTGAWGDVPPDVLESEPTDAAGRGVVSLARDQHDLCVRASGFTPSGVSASDRDPLPLEVVLVPSATIEVRLGDAHGDVPPGLEVRIESGEPLFFSGSTPRGADKEAPFPQHSRASGSVSCLAGVDAHGLARIAGLRAGVPFNLVPVDAYGTRLPGPRGLTLAPGERRALELAVLEPPRTLVVCVRDSLGFPVWGADVTVSAPGSRWWRMTNADRAGMLRLPDVYAPLVELSVSSEYFRPRSLERVAAPPEGATIEVVLARDWWPW